MGRKKKDKKSYEVIDTELKFVQLKVKLGRRKYQEQVVEWVRLNRFKAFSFEQAVDLVPELGKISDKQKDHQFFIQVIKQGEQYSEDRRNYDLIIAIKFHGKQVKRVYFYWHKKYRGYIELEWKQLRQYNFSKPVKSGTKYPKEMTHRERYLWRVMSAKLIKKPTAPKDDNFLKWNEAIVSLNNLEKS